MERVVPALVPRARRDDHSVRLVPLVGTTDSREAARPTRALPLVRLRPARLARSLPGVRGRARRGEQRDEGYCGAIDVIDEQREEPAARIAACRGEPRMFPSPMNGGSMTG